MNPHRARLVVCWIAALAMLWAALMPHLSLAAAPNRHTVWLEACTSQGPVQLALEIDEDSAALSPFNNGHCLFCRLSEGAPDLTLTPVSVSVARTPPLRRASSVSPSKPFTSIAWRAPQSRAPPARQT